MNHIKDDRGQTYKMKQHFNFTERDKRAFSAFCLVAEESTYRTDISMSKIAAKMGISRQALGKNYFRNVNEIIYFLHVYIDQTIQPQFKHFVASKRTDLPLFMAKELLPLLYDKREYLHVLYGSVADPSWNAYLENTYTDILEPYFSTTAGIEARFLAQAVTRQILTIIGMWMADEIPEHPLTFSDKFLYLMNHSVNDLVSIQKRNSDGT
ncbi:MAG: TetR/AcrR family transcriptional regulator [Lactococcus sp.]